MPFLLDAARSRVEQCLGWAMLLAYSQCCKGIVTESTWHMLEAFLGGRRAAGQGLGRHVGRLYGLLLGVVRRANVPPKTPFPMLSRRNGGFLRAEPLRRVRIQHATAWTEPIGSPRQWQDLRDVFLTRGFDEILPRFHSDQLAGTVWARRQMVCKQLTAELYADVTVSTLRILWRGFHIELLEQVVAFGEPSDSSDAASSSRSRSSGRRMRRQHVGLEHS